MPLHLLAVFGIAFRLHVKYCWVAVNRPIFVTFYEVVVIVQF